jgi:4-hydroxymandelate oxidase
VNDLLTLDDFEQAARERLPHEAKRSRSPSSSRPSATSAWMHPEGEVEAARGAGQAGAVYVVSTASNAPIEEIAAAATAPLWLQIYVQADRGFTRDLLARAEAAGVRAFCLTVDTPVLGTRNRQARASSPSPPISRPRISMPRGGRA